MLDESVPYAFGQRDAQSSVGVLNDFVYGEVTAPHPRQSVRIFMACWNPTEQETVVAVGNGFCRVVGASVERIVCGTNPRTFRRVAHAVFCRIIVGIFGKYKIPPVAYSEHVGAFVSVKCVRRIEFFFEIPQFQVVGSHSYQFAFANRGSFPRPCAYQHLEAVRKRVVIYERISEIAGEVSVRRGSGPMYAANGEFGAS